MQREHTSHADEWHGRHKLIYEVICTYEVEADSKAAAGRVAGAIAQSLSRTGVLRHSSGDGIGTLRMTTARFVRHA